jgi:Cdc6-like AAA superfamily ATPase
LSFIDTVRGWFSPVRADEELGDFESTAPVMRRIEIRASEPRVRRSLPTFRGIINRPRVASQSEARLDRTRAQVRDVFAPTQPVTDERTFAGRTKVLKHLIEVIEHRMSHVVIFGERGIGKTSILHIIHKLASDSDYTVLHSTCGARSEFSSTFRTMLKGVPLRFHQSVSPTTERGDQVGGLASLLPEGEYDARELSEVLSSITSTRVIILLDEYDRVESELFRQSIAELIKNLSDAAARVQLVIAGVSPNLDELIGYVPSIRRNIIGVPIQRLGGDEVREILRIGEEASGLSFTAGAAAMVEQLGNGSPYLVRLIAYHSSMIALDAGRYDVREEDVAAALERMVEETEARLPVLVAQRVRAADPGAYPEALSDLAAMASTPNGWFSLEGGRSSPQVKALIDKFTSAGLIEHRRDPAGEGEALHFVDEGLPSYLWMLAARASRRVSAAA